MGYSFCLSLDFVGVLYYDYGEAALFINIMRNNMGLSEFDAKLTMNDNKIQENKNLRIENNKVLLLPDTEYTEDKVSEITLRMK